MLIFICGIPGSGKTAYLAKCALIRILEHGFEDWHLCNKDIQQLNEGGFKLLEPPTPYKHTCYTDFDLKVNNKIKVYRIDGFKIGFDNPFFETVFIPPYSTIFLDEAHRYYDSRMSKFLRKEVFLWYEMHRHNDYNIYLACQRLGSIDVNIRSLGERFIIMEDLKIKENKYGIIESMTFVFREFKSCEAAENYYLNMDDKNIANLGVLKKETIDFSIFDHYNTRSCKPFFYSGKYYSSFDYYTEEGYQFTLDSFKKFNNEHYFIAPTGFWKDEKRDALILKKLGVYNGD